MPSPGKKVIKKRGVRSGELFLRGTDRTLLSLLRVAAATTTGGRVPKFYFDVRLGECLIRDREGTELLDRNAALAYALDDIREL